MTTEQKQQIAQEIQRLAKMSSQSKVATKAGISVATVSNMVNNKWAAIADEMWRKAKVKLRIDLDWQTADTTNLSYIHKHLVKAQEQSLSFGISHDAGAGKSHVYKLYAKTQPNVIYIECCTYWKSKSFAKELVTACGLDDYGTTEELVERFIDYLSAQHRPLVILDQVDKLKDPAMDFYIDLYNKLDGDCGFVLSGVPALKQRINRGVKRQRTGYYELWSRIGRKWLSLKALTLADVTAVCEANGLDDPDEILGIMENCADDLRRVKKDVQNHFINRKLAA